MKRILLIGNGAREHVIAETFKRSPQECELAVFAKATNPALKALATEYHVGELNDFDALRDFAGRFNPDFAFIGPENPLADGMVDFLAGMNIPSIGPSQALAQIESSKSFARELLTEYEIPGNPMFKVFTEKDGLREYMETELGGDYVVKADALKGGKGVKLSGEHLETIEDGIAYASECIDDDGRVLIEEKFVGEEFSLICFSDGTHVAACPAVQDHKRAYEGDTGPNTGGMGSYGDSDHLLPFIKPEDFAEAMDINQRVVDAMKKEMDENYVGILYGGFIATKNGVRLIEYNARFGDPEAMNILSILLTDLVEICEAMIQGRLNEVNVEFERKATVLKYVVPEGYPTDSVKNKMIDMTPLPEGANAYFASVDEREGNIYLLGSRAVAILGKADTLEEAERIAQKGVETIKGPVFFRKDIGTSELIQKRIDHMNAIRN